MAKGAFKFAFLLGIFFIYLKHSSGFDFWYNSDYVFEGDDFTMTCSVPNLICGLTIYFPRKYPAAAVMGGVVFAAYTNFTTADDIGNASHQTTAMHVAGAKFKRDFGEFLCICGSTTPRNVSIRVNASIDNTMSNDTHATSITSCGYPSDVIWYEVQDTTNDDIELTDHISEERENCPDGGDPELVAVNSTITFASYGRQISELKCCVGNAGRGDKSSCDTINIAYASTTQDTQLTSAQTTDTSAAYTSTQNNGEDNTSITTPTDDNADKPSATIIPSDPKEGETAWLNCTVTKTAHIPVATIWILPNGSFASSDCGLSDVAKPYMEIDCNDAPIGDTFYVISIPELSIDRDDGLYQCSYNNEYDDVQLKITGGGGGLATVYIVIIVICCCGTVVTIIVVIVCYKKKMCCFRVVKLS